jgi:hypothetical protein
MKQSNSHHHKQQGIFPSKGKRHDSSCPRHKKYTPKPSIPKISTQSNRKNTRNTKSSSPRLSYCSNKMTASISPKPPLLENTPTQIP